MMSASMISAMIREKKKKMKEQDGAMTESGIPEDAQEIAINKNHEYGERLSTNIPKEHEEEPPISELVAKDSENAPHEEMASDPHEINEDEHMKMKMSRNSKIKSMMMRMGK